MKQEAHKTHIQ